MPHYPAHFLMGVAALAATLIVWGVTTNRLVKRKLKLSIFLLTGYVALHVALLIRPELAGVGPLLSTPTAADLTSPLRPFERLTLSAALINLIVLTLINPLRQDRVRDGFPAIVQDAIVIGLLLIVGTFVFREELLTTSAVGAVVVGFALQDTLGNAFAGLAIQSERPFSIGHWIKVGDFEGRVAEVTWRATKLRTKSGNFIVLPNNVIAKEPIINYSEPAVPTRLEIEVGASYQASPTDVKAAMHEAMGQAPLVLKAPPPDVLLVAFDASSMNYRARFWVADYERDEEARDQVRTAIHYAFARRGIEIPYPIQVEYSREWPASDSAAGERSRAAVVDSVDIFAGLDDSQRARIAAATVTKTYGDGEAIVRQGDAGDSMYVICSGTVSVVLEPDAREVATIGKGGYFGEMSLLTGEPRTATVVARGETRVLELDADQFRTLGQESPHTVEQVGIAAMARRGELDRAKTAAKGAVVADAPATLLARMKRFLQLRG
jgi:small-conductance mechanosensitive channel/CRP-like cAMP-binding protein